jgi:predicted glycoside hydrolase/deacetylase ChbG (UPF0249 family)
VPILIFNADDYGLSPGVSHGILQAGAGTVRSTTVMANYLTPDEAEMLKQSGMSCGAHLNVSSGKPLTDFPAMLLNEDGTFNKQLALSPDTWNDASMRLAARLEWSAQLKLLLELGLRIDHLDSHHHTHMAGDLFSAAADLARETHLPLRCRHMMRGYLRDAGVRCPDDLVESYFGAGNLTREALLSHIEQAQGEVVEVMCHPGIVDEALRRRSGYLEEREQELVVLSDPQLAADLQARGWTLGTYASL